MNILMLTNTYKPHVGGVAKSVEAFACEYRRQGHRVLVVAPEFENTPQHEEDVLRVPAIQKFNGSDFSLRLPTFGRLSAAVESFRPELVHSHHPFLLGDKALRVAADWNVPLVFTHHTMYERYTHYVPGDSPALQRFVVELSTAYANMCNHVFAPSESVAQLLRDRGVRSPMAVVPTGVDVARFGAGNGRKLRRELGIPADAFVIGHVGRLAPEKNLPYLSEAVATFLQRSPHACFLVVGSGPSGEEIRRRFDRSRLTHRLYFAGTREGQELVDSYHAMDAFAFASQTETQGMVLTEAMAAGLPVVALDASGVREVVRDGCTGRILANGEIGAFAEALAWVAGHPNRERLSQAARKMAQQFSIQRTAEMALEHYQDAVEHAARADSLDRHTHPWQSAMRRIETEWGLWSCRAHAASQALRTRSRGEFSLLFRSAWAPRQSGISAVP